MGVVLGARLKRDERRSVRAFGVHALTAFDIVGISTHTPDINESDVLRAKTTTPSKRRRQR